MTPSERDGAAAGTAEEDRRTREPGLSRASAPGAAPTPGPGAQGPGASADALPGTERPAPPRIVREGDALRFSGALTGLNAGPAWRPAVRDASGARVLDLSRLETLDTGGAALILAVRAAAGEGVRIEGASRPVAAVLERTEGADRPPPAAKPARRLGPISTVGAWAVGRGRAAKDGIAFLGEAAATIVNAARRPRGLRWADVMRHMDEAGTRAFGLIALLGVLIGVILAFQSSIPMRQYGAEIFIPRLVGISLLRELGPLMAAVILAGRTGSAFAAELGTMTVNEEVSALRIMGIDPMVLLVLPRMIAATLAMPVLALLMDLAGLFGMAGVMLSLGFPVRLVANQVQYFVTLRDLLGGLGKAAVFGLVIAGIGCRAGLSAGSGPRAVGDAATSAVVGGIVAIVVLDGIFAVLFFRLGW